ncbi:MAG: UDP-N-acetylmuramoyl-tripeptide--D-alanyl-D-alanine ligase [Acidimicrobiia bacterium]
MTWALVAACVVATIPAGLRWLRVAQREHYLAPSVTRFAWRWWGSSWLNSALVALALLGVVGAIFDPWYGFLAAVSQFGPVGLSLRGVTSPLAWTGRLRRLAVVSGLVVMLVFVVGGLTNAAWLVALGVVAIPVIVDLASTILGPVEFRLGDKWVTKAAGRLSSSGAKVVAITGSYGKTTTKQYTAHLLSGAFRTVASPASFNNRMGLARSINEHLAPGTEVFVAEMGTYGPGEIAALCEWVKPDVSAIVAIGPVHLERFKSEERIVTAKSEILAGAAVGVIGIDHPLLAGLAESRAGAMRLITVSTERPDATIRIADGHLLLEGREFAPVPDGAFGLNLGVAVGISLALGMRPDQIIARLDNLPRPEHRQTVTTSEKGFSVIDDTYNANPAGARNGLEALVELGAEGRKVLVTPGMVELGPRQSSENREFAAAASGVVDDIVVVGKTNRSALLEGSGTGPASVTVVASREAAVGWVRDNLGPGDAVLYENDLPDHYP